MTGVVFLAGVALIVVASVVAFVRSWRESVDEDARPLELFDDWDAQAGRGGW